MEINWASIIGIILAICIIIIMFPTLDSEVGKIHNCNEEKNIFYRVVTAGGLFGGTKKVVTSEELADGIMTICSKWDGYFFKSNGGHYKP